MNTNRSSVEVRSTVNTVDFERVMNQFSSSFTESFLKVVESQFGIGVQSNVIEEVKPKVVKPKVKSKPSPTNEWFEEYRKSSVDYYIMNRIKEVIKESKLEMIECLSDEEFLWGNFPSYSKIEMENYFKKEYDKDSIFILKLKKLIKTEGYSFEKYSEEEKEWIDKYLSFNPQSETINN
jgi:hypothetical protein